MEMRAKVELFDQIRREYEFGVGTVKGGRAQAGRRPPDGASGTGERRRRSRASGSSVGATNSVSRGSRPCPDAGNKASQSVCYKNGSDSSHESFERLMLWLAGRAARIAVSHRQYAAQKSDVVRGRQRIELHSRA